MNGRLYSIQYVKDDFADGSTFTVSVIDQNESDATGEQVWSQSNVNDSTVLCPRQPTHDYQGNASLYAGSGEPVEDYYILCHERLKFVIASGGNAKSGKFYVKVG